MKEDDVVVVSSDSEEDEEVVWKRKNQNKVYLQLSEKIKPILYYQVLPGYKLSTGFPYTRLQELANDLKTSLALVNVKSTQAFIWKNLIRWLVSMKLCYENVSDCINDRNYNLILTDVMAKYVNYKCQLNSSITDETQVGLISNEIVVTLSLVFSGWVPGIVMTLLKIQVIDEYHMILYPIFRKYLSNKHLHDSNDLISYLRLILCFRKWKKLAHLKEDKEIINEIAVGKSAKELKSDIIDLSTETSDIEPVLPKTVPLVNEDNRSFGNITGLIGFAARNLEFGTRILLINKTLELDDTIEQFFKRYSEHINKKTPKLLECSRGELKPLLIEDLTRSPSPGQLLTRPSSCASQESSQNKINGKQGTKAVDQHLSNTCDISSVSLNNKFNNLNLSSHTIENLSPSCKNIPQNRNNEVVLRLRINEVVDIDDTNDKDDKEYNNPASGSNANTSPMNSFEKQIAVALDRLTRRAMTVEDLVNRAPIEEMNDPVVATVSSDEVVRDNNVELPLVHAESSKCIAPISNPVRIRPIVNSPLNEISVEKPIRKRHGIVSSTTSFEGTGDDSDNTDDDDGIGIHNRFLFSQRSYSKVVEEATSSTNEIPKTPSTIASSQPQRSISSSPCPTRTSSPSPDMWSNISPSSSIRSGSLSRLGITIGSSITAERRVSSLIDEEQPTCSRYVTMPVPTVSLTNKNDKSTKEIVQNPSLERLLLIDKDSTRSVNITNTNLSATDKSEDEVLLRTKEPIIDKSTVSKGGKTTCVENDMKDEESYTSVDIIESSASAMEKAQNEDDHNSFSFVLTSDYRRSRKDVQNIHKSTVSEVDSNVNELLKNISGFIGDLEEECGFENSKHKCGPDKFSGEVSKTPITVGNESHIYTGFKNIKKHFPQNANKQLNDVEKTINFCDLSLEKKVVETVKTMENERLYEQPNVQLDVQNNLKNTEGDKQIVIFAKNSTENSMKENSTEKELNEKSEKERVIDNSPIEPPSASTKLPQSVVSTLENDKVHRQPDDLVKAEHLLKSINDKIFGKTNLTQEFSSIKQHEETLIGKPKSDEKNLIEEIVEDESSIDDIESPPYELISQSERADTPEIFIEKSDNVEEHDETIFLKNTKSLHKMIENTSAENEENSIEATGCQTQIKENKVQTKEKVISISISENIFEAEDVNLTNQRAKSENIKFNKSKIFCNSLELNEKPAKTNNLLTSPIDQKELKISEIINSDHDYVTVKYSHNSINDQTYEKLKNVNRSSKACSSELELTLKSKISDENSSSHNTIQPDQEDGVTKQLVSIKQDEDDKFNICVNEAETIEKETCCFKMVDEGQTSYDESMTDKTDEIIENRKSDAKEIEEIHCDTQQLTFGKNVTLIDTELNFEHGLNATKENDTKNGDIIESLKIRPSIHQNDETIGKQNVNIIDNDEHQSVVSETTFDMSGTADVSELENRYLQNTSDDTNISEDQFVTKSIVVTPGNSLTSIATEDLGTVNNVDKNADKINDSMENVENNSVIQEKTSDSNETPIDSEFALTDLNLGNSKDVANIQSIKTFPSHKESFEEKTTDAKETAEYQVEDSDKNTTSIDTKLNNENAIKIVMEQNTEYRDTMKQTKMCSMIEQNVEIIEKQVNNKDINEDRPVLGEITCDKSSTLNSMPKGKQEKKDVKQTVDITEIINSAGQTTLNEKNLTALHTQHQNETTTDGEHLENSCNATNLNAPTEQMCLFVNKKTQQTSVNEKSKHIIHGRKDKTEIINNEIYGSLSSTKKVSEIKTNISSSLSELVKNNLIDFTTELQTSVLPPTILDKEPLIELLTPEKAVSLSIAPSSETSSSQSQTINSEVNLSTKNKSKRRLLRIRIAKLRILENAMLKRRKAIDALSETITLEEPKITNPKGAEDSGKHQIIEETSHKKNVLKKTKSSKKSHPKKAKKEAKKRKQTLESNICEEVKELVNPPIKDSKVSQDLNLGPLESISIQTDNKTIVSKEENAFKPEVISENETESIVNDVKEICVRKKQEQISSKKDRTKTIKSKQSSETNICEKEIEKSKKKTTKDSKPLTEENENEEKKLLNISPVIDQTDQRIEKQTFDVKEIKLEQSVSSKTNENTSSSSLIGTEFNCAEGTDNVHNESLNTYPLNNNQECETSTQLIVDGKKQATFNENLTSINTQDQVKKKFEGQYYSPLKLSQETRINDREVRNHNEREYTEMSDSLASTNIDSRMQKSSKNIEVLELPTIEVESSSLLPNVVGDELFGEQISKEEEQETLLNKEIASNSLPSAEINDKNKLLQYQKMTDEAHLLTQDEPRKKLIIRLSKISLSKDDMNKKSSENPSVSKALTLKIQKQPTTVEKSATYQIKQETLPKSNNLNKNKFSKKIEQNNIMKANKSNTERKTKNCDVEEKQVCTILKASECISFQVQNQITATDKNSDKNQCNKTKSKVTAEIINEEDVKDDEKYSGNKNKAETFDIKGAKDEGKQCLESNSNDVRQPLLLQTKKLKLSTKEQVLELYAAKCSITNSELSETRTDKSDVITDLTKDNTVLKNNTFKNLKNKKSEIESKQGAASKRNKSKVPLQQNIFEGQIDKLIKTPTKNSILSIVDEQLAKTEIVKSLGNQIVTQKSETEQHFDKSQPEKNKSKVTVENVIEHKSLFKAILGEYMKESAKNNIATSVEKNLAENERNQKQNFETLVEEISKTSNEAKSLYALKTSTLTILKPSTEIEILPTPKDNGPSFDKFPKILKFAECQTEPKSVIGKNTEICSSKCQKIIDASSTAHNHQNKIQNIVQCKDELIKHRNQEVFSQIRHAKQENSIEPDSSSELAKELQRTENTLAEEESNLSTRVQVADLGEPALISDSEISQQNAAVALESDKSIVFYPSRDSAEDLEVSSITSQKSDSKEIYYNYNDENGTPVLDEKNSTEDESPPHQSKITSLSKIKVPTADVHQLTAILISPKPQFIVPTPEQQPKEPELKSVCIENVPPEESPTAFWSAADKNLELWLKKLGLSKNCALNLHKGINISNSTKLVENSLENQKNDRKQKKPRRVQKLDADIDDQKSLNFEDLKAAAILTSFKDQQTKFNTRSRKGLQPTRITRSSNHTEELAKSFLQHDSPSLGCSENRCDILKTLEKCSTPSSIQNDSELTESNGSSDSDDTDKLVIDFDTKRLSKSKPKKKRTSNKRKKEKRTISSSKKTINSNPKIIKKLRFNPIVEIINYDNNSRFRSRGRSKVSTSLSTAILQSTITTRSSKRGNKKQKNNEQVNKDSNNTFDDSLKELKSSIKKDEQVHKPKLPLGIAFPLINAEDPLLIEKNNEEPSSSINTPHNMSQETWLQNLTLRKTSKSLDSESKNVSGTVTIVKKVRSEPNLLQAPKLGLRFLKTKTGKVQTLSEIWDKTNKAEGAILNKTKFNNNPIHEEIGLVEVPVLKRPIEKKIEETTRSHKQLKGDKLNKCIRRLSIEENYREKIPKHTKKPKIESAELTILEDQTVSLVTPTVEESKQSQDSSKTVESALPSSTYESTKHSELEPEIKFVAVPVPSIDKNETKEEKSEKAKHEKFKNSEQIKPVAEDDKEVKSVPKKTNKSNKKPMSEIVDQNTTAMPLKLSEEANVENSEITKPVAEILNTKVNEDDKEVKSIPKKTNKSNKKPMSKIVDQNTTDMPLKLSEEANIENSEITKPVAEILNTKVNEDDKEVKSIPKKTNKSNKKPMSKIVDQITTDMPLKLSEEANIENSEITKPVAEILNTKVNEDDKEVKSIPKKTNKKPMSKIVDQNTTDMPLKLSEEANIENSEITKPVAEILNTKVNEDDKEVKSIPKKTNKSNKKPMSKIVDQITTDMPLKLSEEANIENSEITKPVAEILNTKVEVSSLNKDEEEKNTNKTNRNPISEIVDKKTTAVPSNVLTLNKEKEDKNGHSNDINLKEKPKSHKRKLIFENSSSVPVGQQPEKVLKSSTVDSVPIVQPKREFVSLNEDTVPDIQQKMELKASTEYQVPFDQPKKEVKSSIEDAVELIQQKKDLICSTEDEVEKEVKSISEKTSKSNSEAISKIVDQNKIAMSVDAPTLNKQQDDKNRHSNDIPLKEKPKFHKKKLVFEDSPPSSIIKDSVSVCQSEKELVSLTEDSDPMDKPKKEFVSSVPVIQQKQGLTTENLDPACQTKKEFISSTEDTNPANKHNKELISLTEDTHSVDQPQNEVISSTENASPIDQQKKDLISPTEKAKLKSSLFLNVELEPTASKSRSNKHRSNSYCENIEKNKTFEEAGFSNKRFRSISLDSNVNRKNTTTTEKDVKYLINLKQQASKSSAVKTPTKKEDEVKRFLDMSISIILGNQLSTSDNNAIAEEESTQELKDKQIIKKSVDTYSKRKRPSLDGVQCLANVSVFRRRRSNSTSDVPNAQPSESLEVGSGEEQQPLKNKSKSDVKESRKIDEILELERDFLFVELNAENFNDTREDQSNQVPITHKPETQQSVQSSVDCMFSGNRGQDDEDKLLIFNTDLALETVPTYSPDENVDNLYPFDDFYSFAPTSTLINGSENVSGGNLESAEKSKVDDKKTKEVETITSSEKTLFEEGKNSATGREKQKIDTKNSEYGLNDGSTNISSFKTKPTKYPVLKLFSKTSEKRNSIEEITESFPGSKLKSSPKPFWRSAESTGKLKIIPKISKPRNLDTAISVISLAENSFPMDDGKSLPVYFDEIFEEKRTTKTPSKSEVNAIETNTYKIEPKKQLLSSLSTDDRFDRLKNESPVNAFLNKTSTSTFKDCVSLKVDANNFCKDSSSGGQLDEPKAQLKSLAPSNPSISPEVFEQKPKIETGKTVSCEQTEEPTKSILEPKSFKKSSLLKKIDEPKKSCGEINETDANLPNIILLEEDNSNSKKPFTGSCTSTGNKSQEIVEISKGAIFEREPIPKNLISIAQPSSAAVSSITSICTSLKTPTISDTCELNSDQASCSKKPSKQLVSIKTTQGTSEKQLNAIQPPPPENKSVQSSLKQYPSGTSVAKKELLSKVFCTQISATSASVAAVSSSQAISTSSILLEQSSPDPLVKINETQLSLDHKNVSNSKPTLKRYPSSSSNLIKTPDLLQKNNESKPPVENKNLSTTRPFLKRLSSDGVKVQVPPSKIVCSEITATSVPVVSSTPSISASSVKVAILNTFDHKITNTISCSKKPLKQSFAITTPEPSVKINEIQQTNSKCKIVEAFKPSLKRYASVSDSTKNHEPPSKICRSDISPVSVCLPQVSSTPNQVLPLSKTPYNKLTTSSPNTPSTNAPPRNQTITKPLMVKTDASKILNTNTRLPNPKLQPSVSFPSQSPRNSRIIPLHTTEKTISIRKLATASGTPGTIYSENPRTQTPVPFGTPSYSNTPSPTPSTSSTSVSRTPNTLSVDLARLSAEVESIKKDISKLPKVDTKFKDFRIRKSLFVQLETKQEELKKKKQEYERQTHKSKSHSERKPFHNQYHHHEHHQHQHSSSFQRSNDFKRKHDQSRPHSERQFSKGSTSGHSSHIEQEKKPRKGYVNKFSELDKLNFINKIDNSADTNPEAKKLPPWDHKPSTPDEIIRALHYKKKVE